MPFEGDWIFLQNAVPDLQDYVLSNELYWTLRPAQRAPSGVQIPQLSIGNLVLSQARLAAVNLTGEERARLDELQRAIAAVRSEWRANWGRKASQEFNARLNLWQKYLREARGDERPSGGFYAREVRNRAILQLLLDEMSGEAANQNEQVNMLDGILRGMGQPGDFVWEPELAKGFDPEPFWFLYYDLKK
jgi:hypothetical protein